MNTAARETIARAVRREIAEDRRAASSAGEFDNRDYSDTERAAYAAFARWASVDTSGAAGMSGAEEYFVATYIGACRPTR